MRLQSHACPPGQSLAHPQLCSASAAGSCQARTPRLRARALPSAVASARACSSDSWAHAPQRLCSFAGSSVAHARRHRAALQQWLQHTVPSTRGQLGDLQQQPFTEPASASSDGGLGEGSRPEPESVSHSSAAAAGSHAAFPDSLASLSADVASTAGAGADAGGHASLAARPSSTAGSGTTGGSTSSGSGGNQGAGSSSSGGGGDSATASDAASSSHRGDSANNSSSTQPPTSSSSSAMPPASPAAAAAPAAPPSPGHCTLDYLASLDDVQLAQQAQDWGYARLGRPLPEGVSLTALAETLPDQVFRPSAALALSRAAVALAAMAAGYGWLLYMHSICPLWQQALCWLAVGTGYFGLFQLAADCAHFAAMPGRPWLQDVVGAALMAPALVPYEAWRLRYFNHLIHLNMLGEDTDAWQPPTLAEYAALPPRRRTLLKLVMATPLKLLASLASWLTSWDALDLKRHGPQERRWVLASWALPAGFAAAVWPALLAAGGLGGWVSGWLMPWLVFQAWSSLLSLVQHTAPHIPWRREGLEYDAGQAAINGTVTLLLPRPLELLLGDANYHLPDHVSVSIPSYRRREAHAALAARLEPYLTVASPAGLPRLLLSLMTAWQVYDEGLGAYLDFDDAEAAIADAYAEAAAAAAAGAQGGGGGEAMSAA